MFGWSSGNYFLSNYVSFQKVLFSALIFIGEENLNPWESSKDGEALSVWIWTDRRGFLCVSVLQIGHWDQSCSSVTLPSKEQHFTLRWCSHTVGCSPFVSAQGSSNCTGLGLVLTGLLLPGEKVPFFRTCTVHLQMSQAPPSL